MVESVKILVVGPSWVGDMVMAQVLFKALKQKYPESHIDVLAPDWSLPVLERMPEINSGIAFPFKHGELAFWRRRQFAQQLKGQYSHAYVLPGSLKSALVPWFASIENRIGYLGEQRYGLLNQRVAQDKSRKRYTAEKFFNLAQLDAEMPMPELVVDAQNQQKLQTKFSLKSPIVAFMPGAEYGPAKQWPAEHYAVLAQKLTAQGCQVVCLGSQKDHVFSQELLKNINGAKNLCGQTSLADAIDLLGMANFCVTNDSGLMHIAAAVGTHVYAIYGSSGPENTPPLTEKKTIFYLDLKCSPCFKRTCPLGHTDCLVQITPERVFEVIQNDF